MYYIYVYLDTRKKGSYSYGDFHFEYEPFYIGKGTNDRYLSHLRIANGSRKGRVNKVVAKIKSILNDGYNPEIIKIIENLTKETYNSYEIEAIKIIGKDSNGGPLLNIMDGGDGGITWTGEHHNKGKKLEEIVGVEKAAELKQKLSEKASKRIGELNTNWMNRGEKNPNWGRKHTEEELDKMRQSALNQFSNYSDEEISDMVKRMNEARDKLTDEIKQKWYEERSILMKNKYENGELFSDEHRQKLKETNYKKLNKGSDSLKLSDETKKKISMSQKGRIFTKEHRDKLRKCISFEEFEIVIVDLVKSGLIKTITAYRKYAKDNPDLKYSKRPEESYKNDGWSGWRKYDL